MYPLHSNPASFVPYRAKPCIPSCVNKSVFSLNRQFEENTDFFALEFSSSAKFGDAVNGREDPTSLSLLIIFYHQQSLSHNYQKVDFKFQTQRTTKVTSSHLFLLDEL